MSTASTVEGAGVPDAPTDTGRLDDASPARIWSVLLVIVLFSEIAPTQYTMVAAALQKIAPSFPGVGANITWTMIAFGLVGASASPLIGKMSDVWGKKRLFLICGVLFAVGCLLSALTSNWWVFLLGRCLQATAIATAVVSYGLIRDLLPRRLVPVGLGLTATGFGFSAALAPLLAGWLVDNYQWRAMFWFLFGFTVLMLPIVALVVPDSTLRVREPIDIAGAALLSGGTALVLIYIDKGQDWGWARPMTLLWLLAGILLLVVFVLVELRVRIPVVDIRLLAHPRVSLMLITALFSSCMVGIQGYAIAYMVQTPSQEMLRGTIVNATVDTAAQQYKLHLLPQAVRVVIDPSYSYGDGLTLLQFAVRVALVQGILGMIFGVIAGLVARRIGPWYPLIAAALIFAGVGITEALMPHTWGLFAITSGAFGIAFGLYYAAAPTLVVEAVPQEQQGISLGVLGVMQSMGVAIGTAAITAFLTNNPLHAVVTVAGQTQTAPIPQVFGEHGYVLGFWFAVITSVIGLIVALFMRHGRTPATGGTAF
ncbi:MFS transporter [Nocardia sp. alder85J]|uniref:MFS transporter n=1 Tax=Nocardia sp. alder85J TaxID=2862949 RepID=UPI001CD4D794|nr:MFS transporter [Nocardia sp. alder85J]MCX4091885.1 MFS transporter [Nocardia sp. alder85J]